MKYRRALLLADPRANPAPAISALRRVAPELESLVVVARVRDLERFWSRDLAREPDARDLEIAEAWRNAAADLAPTVELRPVPELRGDDLITLASTSGIDLIVAGARALDSAPLVARVARQLAIAALWPAGEVGAASGKHLFCAALGRRARVAIAAFLREHADASLEVSVVGLPELALDELKAAVEVMGIAARLQLLPTRGRTWRGVLAAAARTAGVDVVVVARMHTLLLVGYSWPAPILLVPDAAAARPSRGGFDLCDLVDLGGRILGRVDAVTMTGSLVPASDEVLALVSAGHTLAAPMTSAIGELELGPEVTMSRIGVVKVDAEWPPNALDAVEHQVEVIRPDARRLALFDCELDDDRLRALRELTEPQGLEPLAVRLRPTRAAAILRRRLQAAGLPRQVVDARAVLDEGAAHDVAEANDEVRLRRVAVRMRAAGFQVACLFPRQARELVAVEPVAFPPIAGNRIEVELDNQRARTWLLDAIAESRELVHFQVYMAADDEVGRAVEAALAAAAARGVTVRVLVDSLHALHGSYGTENPLLARLAARPGVELRVGRPLSGLPSMIAIKKRDHSKLVVVDGRVALVGGRNLSHEYYTGFEEESLTASAPWRRVPWLDAGARLEGPAVAAIARAFREAWVEACGASFEISDPPPLGESVARIVTHSGLSDAHTLEAYLELVDEARSHVYAVNGFPYVLELQHALLRALRRGVRVRAITGHLTPTHDGTPFSGAFSSARNTATEFVHSRLDPIVEAGGEVYLFARRDLPSWQPDLGLVHPHVHAKLMSVDGARVAVGSANFDVTSSYWESELMIVAEDAALAAVCEQRLDELIAGSILVRTDDARWRERARRRAWMCRWPGVLAI